MRESCPNLIQTQNSQIWSPLHSTPGPHCLLHIDVVTCRQSVEIHSYIYSHSIFAMKNMHIHRSTSVHSKLFANKVYADLSVHHWNTNVPAFFSPIVFFFH